MKSIFRLSYGRKSINFQNTKVELAASLFYTLLTISGTKDGLFPFSAVENAIDKSRRIFAKMGCPQNYEGLIFEAPHEFNLEMQEAAFAWLGKQLQA